jgi:hypothetical protein
MSQCMPTLKLEGSSSAEVMIGVMKTTPASYARVPEVHGHGRWVVCPNPSTEDADACEARDHLTLLGDGGNMSNCCGKDE